jgi:hypothetical protein
MLCALAPVRPAFAPSPSTLRPSPASRPTPRLRLDPLAWLKLQFFATTWDCAVGGFGLASGEDPLHIERFTTVPQHVTRDAVRFINAGADAITVARARRRPRRRRGRPRPRFQPSRVMILTHAGTDPVPTDADEALFASALGHLDWSALLVVARDGGTCARLSLTGGPIQTVPLTIEIDWRAWARFVEDQPCQFPRLAEAWKDEYARNVRFADELTEPSPDELWPPAVLSALRRGQLFGGGPDGLGSRGARSSPLLSR